MEFAFALNNVSVFPSSLSISFFAFNSFLGKMSGLVGLACLWLECSTSCSLMDVSCSELVPIASAMVVLKQEDVESRLEVVLLLAASESSIEDAYFAFVVFCALVAIVEIEVAVGSVDSVVRCQPAFDFVSEAPWAAIGVDIVALFSRSFAFVDAFPAMFDSHSEHLCWVGGLVEMLVPLNCCSVVVRLFLQVRFVFSDLSDCLCILSDWSVDLSVSGLVVSLERLLLKKG